MIATQNELKNQRSWILSKKGHAEKFRSKKQRDQWLGTEVDQMLEQLGALEAELEAMRVEEREQQDLLLNTAAVHEQKAKELQDIHTR